MSESIVLARPGPAGLLLRPFAGSSDIGEFVRIFNAAAEADEIDERVSEAGLANWFGHPTASFDASSDLVVAEVRGELVAYGFTAWIDTTDGLREHRSRGHVHPAWRRRGIGSAVLAHNVARARKVAAEQGGGWKRVLGAWAADRQPGAIALLEGNGFEPVRWFFTMVRPTLDGIEVPPMPDGIVVRPAVADRAGYRRVFDADTEAFRDHWGGFDASDEAFEEWFGGGDPNFDPSLWVIAWDGDEIAGGVINSIDANENALLDRQRGLLDSVFVRRPWRRRGLAAALVARSLEVLRQRGMTSAWLGVDADNPNGALGVYQRAGFAVDLRSTAYRKSLVADR